MLPATSRIRDLLYPYTSLAISDALAERIRVYLALLLTWNKKISLTSLTDPEQIIRLHFGESAAAFPLIASLYPALTSSFCRLADVGSGAGFPGVVLKLFCDEQTKLVPRAKELEAVLIEPNQKKGVFLQEVIRALELSSVEVFKERFERWPRDAISSMLPYFDVITSRALSRSPELLAWAMAAMGSSGVLLLWLTTDDEFKLRQLSRGWSWGISHPLPGTHDRRIVFGSPTSA